MTVRTRPVTTLLVALALMATAMAVPAGAKGRPASALVEVSLTSTGAEGLSTECTGGSLVMQRTNDGYSSAPGYVPVLGISMSVDWFRRYPEPMSGASMSGCHGGTVAGSPQPWDGALWIDTDRAGNVTDVLWHFDYYLDSETTVLKNGKERTQPTVREHFTLSGHDLTQNGTTVSGSFTLLYYMNDYVTGEQILYQPLGSRTLTFDIAPAAR